MASKDKTMALVDLSCLRRISEVKPSSLCWKKSHGCSCRDVRSWVQLLCERVSKLLRSRTIDNLDVLGLIRNELVHYSQTDSMRPCQLSELFGEALLNCDDALVIVDLSHQRQTDAKHPFQ